MKRRKQKHIFDYLIEIGRDAAIVMIIFLGIGVCARVIIRYIFGFPINWVIDISTIFQVFLTFLASAWLLREEGHVSIDIVLSFLKPCHRFLMQIINSIICIIICGSITFYGIKETLSSWKSNLYLNMPMEPPKWMVIIVIPFGSLFLLIQFIRRTRDFINKFKDCKNKNNATKC